MTRKRRGNRWDEGWDIIFYLICLGMFVWDFYLWSMVFNLW